jgi:hypothetical protein
MRRNSGAFSGAEALEKKFADCVAVQPVVHGPFSGQFPANRENYREFGLTLAWSDRKDRVCRRHFPALVLHNGGDRNRELLPAKQGTQNREQGIPGSLP